MAHPNGSALDSFASFPPLSLPPSLSPPMATRGPPPVPQEALFALQLPLERLHDDCRRGHKASVYEAIGEKAELVNLAGKLGFTALHWAAQCQSNSSKPEYDTTVLAVLTSPCSTCLQAAMSTCANCCCTHKQT